MKQHQGVWLPDGERHLIEWMDKSGEIVDGRGSYQIRKLRAALQHVRHFRVAVDVGAHVGFWTMHLAKRFETVHSFEPVAAHRECFAANVHDERVSLHACALGDREGRVSIHTAATSSGDSWVDGDGDIPLRRLDAYALENVDFIKLDCEGYELFALRGGEETLKRCKPCVIVEQKPGRAQKFGLPETGAVKYLQGLGATLRATLSGDFILSWG
jgi:FkbM family methyltransferase